MFVEQVLHDVGDFDRFTAFSSSVVDAKKMCISRNARYSGLIDVLDFAEGGDSELATAFGGASTWVAINADETSLPAQIGAAGTAGVKRIFVHISASDSAPGDESAIKTALESSGATYTVMRTGSLAKSGSGGGLLVGDFDMATCDEVPLDDAFRFLVESLALPESESRLFSLCPSIDDSQLKEMRMAGCSRTEETQALLKGLIIEKKPEEREAEKEATADAAAKEEDPRSDEEKKAAAEEEVKMLLARARAKGEENQKRMAEEEAAKAEKRAERQAYFAQNMPAEGEEGEGDKEKAEGESKGDDDKPETKGEGDGDGGSDGGKDDKPKGGDDEPKKDGDDDDDGLALV